MSNPQLLSVLKTMGFSNNEIRKITAAAESAEIDSIRATRGDLTELPTPMACASRSARHAALLRQLDSTIFHCSACTYRLPKDQPVDLLQVERAIRNADIPTRAAIKSGLRELGLIAA